MAKLILTDLANLQNESTSVTVLKQNNDAIETSMENTLSRDGTSPNQMLSNLDMNNYKIINLPDATTDQEPATYSQLTSGLTAVGNGAVIDAQYVTLATNPNLLSERVLTGSSNISVTDGGAAGPVTLDVNASTLRSTLSVDQTDNTSDATKNSATATLTNKTIDTAGPNTILINGNTLAANAGTATVTIPNSTDTLVGRNTVDTLANKTLTSPVMTSPVLGTPTSGVATNLTGTAAGLTAGNVTTNANLTGVITSVGNATSIASQTGSGTKFVVDTSPTLVTPTIGAATATSINKVTITAPATSATLTIPNGVTLTGPSASGTAMTLGNAETVTGAKTFNSSKLLLAGSTSGSTIVNASATASGTLTLPAATDTIVGRATTDTLTNKTLTSPVISSITNTGTLTLPTSTDTLIGRATTDTLTNKTISGSSNTLSNIALSSLSTQAANTLVANVTGSSAAPTAVDISTLTTKASPAGTDYTLISDQGASGALKKVTVSSLASAGSVASIAGNTGAFTLSHGITNSTNDIQINAGSVPGIATNTAASAGNVGELLISSATTGSLTSGVGTAAVSLTLSAGDWDLQGMVQYNTSGGTSVTDWYSAMCSTNSSTFSPLAGTLVLHERVASMSDHSNSQTHIPTQILISSSTTYYFMVQANFTGTAPTATVLFRARRIR